MRDHIRQKIYHVEALTPKQATADIAGDLEKFAEKYRTLHAAGCTICITDNPMGLLSFQGTEVIEHLGLPVDPQRLCLHLNTFHSKRDFDAILEACIGLGIEWLLLISGDGSVRLPRLSGRELGCDVPAVTSVELLKYVHREYPGRFRTGVAYNPYEPQEHELEKMRRKIGAGAEFAITQPILEKHPALDHFLEIFDLPVIVEAWMMKKLHLLSECVGYEIPEGTVHDPLESLAKLIATYPACGFYLSFLGMKTQLPEIGGLWQ